MHEKVALSIAISCADKGSMIQIIPLGAGQDVGRSCIVALINGKCVMFDCGMHMGYNDDRRFPDFSVLSPSGHHFSSLVDVLVISHFHLDHCGALPYFTEQCGYEGPIVQ
jgi:integrator complex subunit 11